MRARRVSSTVAAFPGSVFFRPFGRNRPLSTMEPGHTSKRMAWNRTLPVKRVPDCAPADLLIPACLLHYARSLKHNRGQWRDLIVFLIARHRSRVLELAEAAENLRFRHQDDGLRLHRICYLPYRDTMVELRMLSLACRMSMCALVVLMLQWEQQGEESANPGHSIGITRKMAVFWIKTEPVLTISAEIQTSYPGRSPSTS